MATRGGALATRGGALATRGGALATRGGASATRGGASATRGGASATRGGAVATRAVVATRGGVAAGEYTNVIILQTRFQCWTQIWVCDPIIRMQHMYTPAYKCFKIRFLECSSVC